MEEWTDEVKALRREIASLKKDMEVIRIALVGNEEFRQKGILERLDSLELFKAGIVIKSAMISGGVSALGLVAYWVLQIIKHTL